MDKGFVTITGSRAVAAWLDWDSAEKLHTAQILSLEARIERLQEKVREASVLWFLVGTGLGVVGALLAAQTTGALLP